MNKTINAERLKEWFLARDRDLFSVNTICAIIDMMSEEDCIYSSEDGKPKEEISNEMRAHTKYTEITNRIQEEDNMNKVYFLDEKGPGGGYHDYMVLNGRTGFLLADITFQNGPRMAQESMQGVLDVDLLEIVRHRLRTFLAGDMADLETESALDAVELALIYLDRRKEERKKRGVLGTMER